MRNDNKETVLLIGGAGYIGSVLTDHLLARQYNVRCLDLLLYRNHASVMPFLGRNDYEFMVGDLSESKTLERALDGVRDVVLLAGLVGDPITKKYPEAAQLINDKGLSSCIDMLNNKALNKVVFISTCSNYGLMPEGVEANEDSDLTPLSLYAKSKVALEKKILSLRGSLDYCPTILRFATAFGLSPRMRFDLTISEFTRSLFLGEKLEVYDADTWRPYCHVRDFARAIDAVLHAPNDKVCFEVFNVGGEENNYTKKMIATEILRLLPASQVCYREMGQDRRNYKVDFKKIQRVLGFTPQISVPSGIRELLVALGQGFFADHDQKREFYGNYAVEYPSVKIVESSHAF